MRKRRNTTKNNLLVKDYRPRCHGWDYCVIFNNDGFRYFIRCILRIRF